MIARAVLALAISVALGFFLDDPIAVCTFQPGFLLRFFRRGDAITLIQAWIGISFIAFHAMCIYLVLGLFSWDWNRLFCALLLSLPARERTQDLFLRVAVCLACLVCVYLLDGYRRKPSVVAYLTSVEEIENRGYFFTVCMLVNVVAISVSACAALGFPSSIFARQQENLRHWNARKRSPRRRGRN